jgi:hypothetical protein
VATEIASLPLHRDESGPHSWAEHRWHQADVRRYPEHMTAVDDLWGVFADLVDGYAPERPLLVEEDNVVTIGSCFAARLRQELNVVGFSSDSVWVPSGLNNTFAIADFVSWCVHGRQTNTGYRYDRSSTGEVAEWQPEGERATYRERFAEAGAFIFTLGLAEVWEDSETGEVFWRGVPEHVFDEGRHVFRLSTVEENVRNIDQIVATIREVNPDAPIVLTLSPVPLKATFRDVSCVAADAVSKSILRVALDLATSKKSRGVYYWPSFEMVRWVGAHLPWEAYGLDDGCVRHPSGRLVDPIIDTFAARFYVRSAYELFRARRQGA